MTGEASLLDGDRPRLVTDGGVGTNGDAAQDDADESDEESSLREEIEVLRDELQSVG